MTPPNNPLNIFAMIGYIIESIFKLIGLLIELGMHINAKNKNKKD